MMGALAAAAPLLASCAGPEPYCGGFEESIVIDVQVQRLSLDLDDVRPVQAEICPMLPRECACVSTDTAGFLRSELPANSDVLVEIRAPRYLTTVGTTTTGSEDRLAALRLVDRTTIAVLASLLDETIDDERGHLGLRAAPAEGASVAGTVFVVRQLETGDTHRVIYTADGLPSVDATSSDDSGVALGVNLPPGRYRVESSTLLTCGVADAGWPRYDAEGRIEALEFEIRPSAVTLLDVLRCSGTAP